MVDVSVVVVNWNSRDLLRPCLRSVLAQTEGISLDVTVVDNASADGSAAMVSAEFPSVGLVANRRNVGPTGAHNQAISFSDGRYLLFLNADTEAHGNAIGHMAAFMDAHPRVGALGAKLLNSDGSLQPSCHNHIKPRKALAVASGLADLLPYKLLGRLRPGHLIRRIIDFPDHDKVLYPECFVGATMMFRPEALRQAGPFDPEFPMYGQEVDMMYRLRALGWQIAYTPDAVFTHHGGAGLKIAYRPLTLNWWQSLHLLYEKHFDVRQVRLLRAAMLVGVVINLLGKVVDMAFRVEKAPEKFRTLGAVLCWGLRDMM